MRIAVLIVGILGSVGALGLGVIWFSQKDSPEAQLVEQLRRELDFLGANQLAEIKAYDRVMVSVWFLFAAVPLGIAGAFLAKEGRGFSGAALLFLAVLGPTVLAPKSLLFTFLLIIAAGLSLFVKRPKPAPAD